MITSVGTCAIRGRLLREVRTYLWLGVAGGLFLPVAAVAQQAMSTSSSQASGDDRTLEDIVVTARKQSETLMRVPVAASVVSGASIASRGITDMSSLAKLIPQVGLEPTTGSAGGSMTIRGIGSSGTDAGGEQTVAVNFDGVQVSRGQIIREALFDLDQVEVLKGPQALFFGKNSPGGVLSVRSRGPGDTLEIEGKASYEFDAQEKIVEFGVSAPLTDTLRIRVAARGRDMRGWMTNDAQSVPNPFFAGNPGLSPVLPGATYKYNGEHEVLGRVTLQYRPTTDFTATLRAFGSANKYNGDNAIAEFSHCADPDHPTTFGMPDVYNNCTLDAHQSIGALPAKEASTSALWRDGKPYGRFTSYLSSLTMEYSPGPISFTSVTGFLHYNQQAASNAGNSYIPYAGYAAGLDKYSQLSQELRLSTRYDSPLNISAGLYYERNKVSTANASTVAPFGPDPLTGKYAMWERSSTTTGNTYSAFIQARWTIVETVELAGGVRYTHEAKQGSIGNDYILPVSVNPLAPLFAPQGLRFHGGTDSSNFSPEVTLSWHPGQNTTLYAAYKTGYLSGGFGAPSTVTANFKSISDFVYEPENAKGGEIGLKAMLLDNSVRLTAAAYRYDYKNLQLSNFIAANFQQDILNAGASRTEGFEAEAQWRATHRLTLSGGIGFSKARYTSFHGIACYAGQPDSGLPAAQTPRGLCATDGTQDLSGMPLVRAPRWTATGSLAYDVPVFGDMKLGLSADARYSGRYFTQENDSPFAIQKAYAQVDAALRLSPANDHWHVAVIGRNLSDKIYAINSFDNANGAPGDIAAAVSRPRQVSLEVGFHY